MVLIKLVKKICDHFLIRTSSSPAGHPINNNHWQTQYIPPHTGTGLTLKFSFHGVGGVDCEHKYRSSIGKNFIASINWGGA